MAGPPDPARPGEVDLSRVADTFVDARRDAAIKRGYLRHFAGAARVLDVGCGSGAFLDVLAQAGIAAVGLDASGAAAAECARRGHRVVAGDARALLARLHAERETFDGVLIAHLVEHLEATAVVDLLAAAARVLTASGRLVVVTPNVRNLVVLTEVFWLDPTHLRPYPRALLERLGAAVALRIVASYDDDATVPVRSLPRRWLARLRSALSGADRSSPQDAVVVFARA